MDNQVYYIVCEAPYYAYMNNLIHLLPKELGIKHVTNPYIAPWQAGAGHKYDGFILCPENMIASTTAILLQMLEVLNVVPKRHGRTKTTELIIKRVIRMYETPIKTNLLYTPTTYTFDGWLRHFSNMRK